MEGKRKVNIHNIQGKVGLREVPDYSFIFETSLVKSPKWNVGDRAILGDGREYVYSKSASACISGMGAKGTLTGYTAYTAFAVAGAVGDSEVTVPAATHAALTEDELAGGYIIIFDGSTNNVQFRGIVGNAAAAANALFKVYLDAALTEAVVASTSACETYKSHFAAVNNSSSLSLPVLGVPAVKVTATDTYFWLQVKGPCWIAPQTSVDGHGGLGVMWRYDGSLEGVETALAVTVATYDTAQYAGHLLQGGASGNGPLVNLNG